MKQLAFVSIGISLTARSLSRNHIWHWCNIQPIRGESVWWFYITLIRKILPNRWKQLYLAVTVSTLWFILKVRKDKIFKQYKIQMICNNRIYNPLSRSRSKKLVGRDNTLFFIPNQNINNICLITKTTTYPTTLNLV